MAPLEPWEVMAKTQWAHRLQTRATDANNVSHLATTALTAPAEHTQEQHGSLRDKAREALDQLRNGDKYKEHVGNWLGKLVHETNVGAVVKELL